MFSFVIFCDYVRPVAKTEPFYKLHTCAGICKSLTCAVVCVSDGNAVNFINMTICMQSQLSIHFVDARVCASIYLYDYFAINTEHQCSLEMEYARKSVRSAFVFEYVVAYSL